MILVKLKDDLVIHLLTARVLAGAGVTQLDNTFVTKIMGESCFYRLCCPVTSILPQGQEATTARQVIVNRPWKDDLLSRPKNNLVVSKM